MTLRCGGVVPPLCIGGAPARARGSTALPSVVALHHPHHRDVGSHQLRIQLDQLRAEAESTRSKSAHFSCPFAVGQVNTARLRLMRLTEAAENLQRRAATKIQVGKETEARELLIQKKKLMKALEKSKNRIEVLDKLSAKINEWFQAISLKETQLIGQVAIQSEDDRPDFCQSIHFVSPKEDTIHESKPKDCFSSVLSIQTEHQKLGAENYEEKLPVEGEQPNFQASESSDMLNSVNMADSSAGFQENILEHVDMQLRLVEADIENFLRSQSSTNESKEKQMNDKLQKISEILKDVLSIRERIARMMETKTDDMLARNC